jgi:glycosyltransferase involved in cell wall biosynthesis
LSTFNIGYFLLPALKWRIGKAMFEELQQYDVVHIHGASSALPYFLSRKPNGQKWIFSPHYHPLSKNALGTLLRPIFDVLYVRRLCNLSDALVFVSDFERDAFVKSGLLARGATKLNRVVPNGVDLEDIRAASPYEVGRKIVLVVGRLVRYKRTDLIIRAMAHLHDDYELRIIGEGPDASRLRKLAEKNKAAHIAFMANVDRKSLLRWYKTASVYVNVSEVEAFSISTLEAVVAGTPCVVRLATGLSDIQRAFPRAVIGLESSRCDPRAIADAIQSATSKGVPEGVEEYSWRVISSTLMDLYVKVAGEIR